nr:hypothetical protein [Rhodoferax sp.]
MTSLRTTVQSFDLFDTLVARACVSPSNLFSEVGRALGVAEFASARMHAEHSAFATSDSFDLPAIYRQLCATGYCDAGMAARLMAAEIEAEFDNAIPIAENLATVRDCDLVVSDMYLPAATLRGLLQHVGLRRFVHLFVSNAGKHRATIWPQLSQRWLILRHIGDNALADVTQPREFGIATKHFTGAAPNSTEQYLDGIGLTCISRIARRLRLANPYVPDTLEAELWNHFATFNIPLLCACTVAVRKQRDACGKQKILFLSRDCHFLSEVFLALYPGEPSELVYVSRGALAADVDGFARYFKLHDLDQSLVCDLVSTGLSWLRFSQSTHQSITFFALVHIDNHQYQTFDASELSRDLNFHFQSATRSSEIDKWSLAIEMLNTAAHGSAVGLDAIGDDFVPRFDTRHELPSALVKTLVLAQAAAIQCLHAQRHTVRQELTGLRDANSAIATLVQGLSAIDWINRFASFAICQPKN